VGYNFVGDITGLSLFFYPLLPSKIAKSCEIPIKFDLYSSSKSSKVIDLGVNRKLICDFLSVINSSRTLALSVTVFEILMLKARNGWIFPPRPCLRPLVGIP